MLRGLQKIRYTVHDSSLKRQSGSLHCIFCVHRGYFTVYSCDYTFKSLNCYRTNARSDEKEVGGRARLVVQWAVETPGYTRSGLPGGAAGHWSTTAVRPTSRLAA